MFDSYERVFNDLMPSWFAWCLIDAVVGDPSRWYHHTYLLNLENWKGTLKSERDFTWVVVEPVTSSPAQPSSIEHGIDPSSLRCKTLSRTFVCTQCTFETSMISLLLLDAAFCSFRSVPHPYPQILPKVWYRLYGSRMQSWISFWRKAWWSSRRKWRRSSVSFGGKSSTDFSNLNLSSINNHQSHRWWWLVASPRSSNPRL